MLRTFDSFYIYIKNLMKIAVFERRETSLIFGHCRAGKWLDRSCTLDHIPPSFKQKQCRRCAEYLSGFSSQSSLHSRSSSSALKLFTVASKDTLTPLPAVSAGFWAEKCSQKLATHSYVWGYWRWRRQWRPWAGQISANSKHCSHHVRSAWTSDYPPAVGFIGLTGILLPSNIGCSDTCLFEPICVLLWPCLVGR